MISINAKTKNGRVINGFVVLESKKMPDSIVRFRHLLIADGWDACVITGVNEDGTYSITEIDCLQLSRNERQHILNDKIYTIRGRNFMKVELESILVERLLSESNNDGDFFFYK